MPTLQLKKGRGFAKVAGAPKIDREKVKTFKKGKPVDFTVKEMSGLKPGTYKEATAEQKPTVKADEYKKPSGSASSKNFFEKKEKKEDK